MKKIKYVGMMVVVLLVVVLSGCSQNENVSKNSTDKIKKSAPKSEYAVDSGDMVKPRTLIGDTAKGEITESEKEGLIKMREEEKLAHDVYITLYEKWGQNVFNNIAKSEQTHTDTIKFILDKYEIDDPAKDKAVGDFESAEMQSLYNDLVEKGSASKEDALIVGATVEDLDIYDLNELLKDTKNEDIITAYNNLVRGSRNHLRAFVKNLNDYGVEYKPQYISEEEYTQIIEGSQERGVNSSNAIGGGNGSGDGSGNGGGRGYGRNHK